MEVSEKDGGVRKRWRCQKKMEVSEKDASVPIHLNSNSEYNNLTHVKISMD